MAQAAEFLIIGQGLAGSLLAWALIQRGCKVIIVDNGLENASQVAAGLINPVTGPRLVKTPDVDYLLPAAIECYTRLSIWFGQAFYIANPMLRIFQHPAEAAIGAQRVTQLAYQPYLKVQPVLNTYGKHTLHAPLGGLAQQQTGYLLTQPLLQALRTFFITQGCYRQTTFEYAALRVEPSLCWQDVNPERVIFCEGYRIKDNTWFAWLPLQAVKGEILSLTCESPLPNTMLNYGHWLIPVAGQQFRIGATFERNITNTACTLSAKQQLLQKLHALSPSLAAATLYKHQANIRPCSLDRNPLIGHHPRYPYLSVFNGFGAKGSLQIPWFSEQFADCLLRATPPLSSSDLQRYTARYYP